MGIQGWEGKGKAGKETEANGGRKQEEMKRNMDDTRRRRQTLSKERKDTGGTRGRVQHRDGEAQEGSQPHKENA